MTTQNRRLTRPQDRVDLIVRDIVGEWDEDYARRLIYKNPQLARSLVLEAGVEYDAPERSAS